MKKHLAKICAFVVIIGLNTCNEQELKISSPVEKEKGSSKNSEEITYDEIFSNLGNFDLLNCIHGAIEERYGYDRLMRWDSQIPIQMRVLHYTSSATGYLEGEGFARFFNLECDHQAYSICFNTLQLPELAANVENALQRVPPHTLGNTEAIIAHFGTWEHFREALDDHEALQFESSKRIFNALYAYMHENKEIFRELYPHMQTQPNFEDYQSAKKASARA